VNRSFIATGIRQITRLREVVDELLDFSRLETGGLEIRQDRLDALGRDVLADFTPMGEGRTITYHPPAGPAMRCPP
jgi:signal transduction histidine kinase